MATEVQIQKVIQGLSERLACRHCETRLRFGDMDCPHCGADIEDDIREWAARLVDGIINHTHS